MAAIASKLVMVLDANGRINAAGPASAGFVVPEGGSLVPAPATIHADLARLDGPNVDLIWRGGKIITQARPQPKEATLESVLATLTQEQRAALLALIRNT